MPNTVRTPDLPSEAGLAGPGGTVTDGRNLRSERSRVAVVEAFLDLLQAGVASPTAAQVAEASGVSMRSIFRLFEEIEQVHAAAIDTQTRRVAHLLVEIDPGLPLDQRIDEFVTTRAHLFETVTPVRRTAVRLAPTSEPIAKTLAASHAYLRSQVLAVFEPEAPADEILAAIDSLSSWEAWERLRVVSGLTIDDSKHVLMTGLRALLLSNSADDIQQGSHS